jgi:sugar phosphate isomerase/epimerase
MSVASRPIGISHLTAPELAPPDLVRAAAACGCQAVGVRMIPVVPGGGAWRLMEDPALLRETRRAVAETGVGIGDLEIAMLRPETDVREFRSFLEAGAELSAKHVLVAGYDPEESRLVARFAEFCDLAAPFGLTADLEFMPWSNVPDLLTATRVVAVADRANGGVLLDPLHFDRSGGRIEDLAHVPRAQLHYWQICDAPGEKPASTEAMLHTARAERLFPGEGGLDLGSLIRAMPADLLVAIEVPKAELARSVGGAERVRRAAAATRDLLARAMQAETEEDR